MTPKKLEWTLFRILFNYMNSYSQYLIYRATGCDPKRLPRGVVYQGNFGMLKYKMITDRVRLR